MHDVAKPQHSEAQVKSPGRRILSVALWLILLVAFIAGLKAAGIPIMMMVVVVLAAVAIVSGLLSFRRFREGRTTAGALLAVVCLLCVLIDIKASQIKKMAGTPFAMPPTAVSSVEVQEEDWAPVLSSVGSISAIQGAIVSTELGGTVAEIGFQNGAPAKKGDVLIKLDASQEEALLRSSEAEVELARSDLERARDLEAKKVVSKADLDAAESKFRRLTAVVDQMRSNIRKKTVVAPFDGQLGIRQVNVGQMINSGQPVVPLELLDSVFVDFALPQQHLSKLSPGLEVRVRTDAAGGKEFVGKLTAINPGVETATRNVSVQATLENPGQILRPGMFAKIELVLPEKNKTLVIPGSAVSYAPYGDSVYVIEKKKDPKTGKESQTIRQQVVRVGGARGDFVAITEGLKPGQNVVSSGVFKLRNGMAVTINNALAPKPQLNPTPVDS